ncbi:MAG TPA: AbrB/MazE/SpoVT family DNA-binding domain-containing protein [Candidatus Acidoferrales bacterium]|nr:AbrB/MazE/SpoVT family DNA-binding domain-containing protein [Candidatus Acidoferrales bacterium]
MASVRLGRQGRLVIPADLRRKLGLNDGDELVARDEDGRLVIERRSAVLTRIRRRLQALPAEVSLVDDLLAERRREAQRE